MKKYYFLYEELRRTKEELIECLEQHDARSPVFKYIEEELKDVEHALIKIESGDFGRCEHSGELIPLVMLGILPTARSTEDFRKLNAYLRKSLYS